MSSKCTLHQIYTSPYRKKSLKKTDITSSSLISWPGALHDDQSPKGICMKLGHPLFLVHPLTARVVLSRAHHRYKNVPEPGTLQSPDHMVAPVHVRLDEYIPRRIKVPLASSNLQGNAIIFTYWTVKTKAQRTKSIS
jgi:hypothetical protein